MARQPSPPLPEVRRILSLLEMLVREKRMSVRAFERQAKMPYGTFARLCRGKGALRVQTLLQMLQALEVPPLVFFNEVFTNRESASEAAKELLRTIQAFKLPSPSAEAIPSREEITRLIETALSGRPKGTKKS